MAVLFKSLQLKSIGPIDDLPSPFHAHFDGIDIEDKVDVFHGVNGQDGKLTHILGIMLSFLLNTMRYV